MKNTGTALAKSTTKYVFIFCLSLSFNLAQAQSTGDGSTAGGQTPVSASTAQSDTPANSQVKKNDSNIFASIWDGFCSIFGAGKGAGGCCSGRAGKGCSIATSLSISTDHVTSMPTIEEEPGEKLAEAPVVTIDDKAQVSPKPPKLSKPWDQQVVKKVVIKRRKSCPDINFFDSQDPKNRIYYLNLRREKLQKNLVYQCGTQDIRKKHQVADKAFELMKADANVKREVVDHLFLDVVDLISALTANQSVLDEVEDWAVDNNDHPTLVILNHIKHGELEELINSDVSIHELNKIVTYISSQQRFAAQEYGVSEVHKQIVQEVVRNHADQI